MKQALNPPALRRLPLLLTVAAVAALSASLAYWGLQLFKPPQRAIAAAPFAPPAPLDIEAAKGLFGGQAVLAVVSNYQLKGVVAARGADSAAIIAVDGKPAMALAVGREVAPGVVVREVHPKYVMLSEGGVAKRLELASDAGATSGAAMLLQGMPGQAQPGQPGIAPQNQQPIQPQSQPQSQPQMRPPPQFQQQPGQPGKSGAITPILVPGFDRQQ